MRLNILKSLFVASALILSALLPLSTAAETETGATPQSAIFAIPAVWPWGYRDRHGEPAGSLVQLAHRLVAIADVPIDYELRPHRRAVAEIVQGRSDFVVLFENPAIDSAAFDLGVVVQTEVLLTARADSETELSMEGLAGQTVAFVSGTYYGEVFRQADKIEKVPVRDVFQALEMLKRGRVSAVLCSDQALYHTLKSLDLPYQNFRMNVFRKGQEGHLYMSRKAMHPELREPLADALEQLRQTGELESIFHLPE
ncbi:substrate-binding periplasmic protein [Marinobacter fonticola]|uniref:substrate-binding periplasmic protein n=1 Tax=Marinobacter fonticola TaxID=2603215 RepID=UPI0011E83F46|nr:transporter substrate-binding domain-containing protein [Marinobacter fonticola]